MADENTSAVMMFPDKGIEVPFFQTVGGTLTKLRLSVNPNQLGAVPVSIFKT